MGEGLTTTCRVCGGVVFLDRGGGILRIAVTIHVQVIVHAAKVFCVDEIMASEYRSQREQRTMRRMALGWRSGELCIYRVRSPHFKGTRTRARLRLPRDPTVCDVPLRTGAACVARTPGSGSADATLHGLAACVERGGSHREHMDTGLNRRFLWRRD